MKCNTGYGLLTWNKNKMRWGWNGTCRYVIIGLVTEQMRLEKWKMCYAMDYRPGTKTNEVERKNWKMQIWTIGLVP